MVRKRWEREDWFWLMVGLWITALCLVVDFRIDEMVEDIERLQFVWDSADAYVEDQTPQTFDALCVAIYATREAVPE